MKPKTVKAYKAACDETRQLHAALETTLTSKLSLALWEHFKTVDAVTMKIIVEAVAEFIHPFPEFPKLQRTRKPSWKR